jgi:hypothetical protein
MKFEILTVANVKNTLFWNVVPTWYCGDRGTDGIMEQEMVTNKLTP